MGVERINKAFQNGKKAFIPYVMGGDGDLQEQIRFLDEAGASIIEIGIPFSDPVADGPTIQRAGKRALENGTTLEGIFQALAEVRATVQIPFVLMTYLNPILAFGKERFTLHCIEAGVDGIIVPDLPYEEQDIIAPLLCDANIALIPLVTVTSRVERIEMITSESQGFVYAVTVAGVTGVRRDFTQELHTYLEKVKAHVQLPVVAGFGISKAGQIEEMTRVCDGVVVGSKVIELLESEKRDEIRELIAVVK
ncbi:MULTISPECIES: tryptophan synthase subunit alpha [unclassified Bacillus (in: firmicutes)]|uniref:tryptophan synthase subunit alpha n=1 Tax=unclassified Bacillus (in: firmicutes) TaxID=185979 RepID=UPI0008F2C5C3|nr:MULTISPECIES: tryptophan synthase subunit alpha [unclassified Bacillus (in: firmicutes)]SFI89934.1 tryptophan synthase, alpha chain [Bacillus sp. 71mf]SFS66568.1 tryptophan synthase, alpha chain [Bacillus sp. 103mf]